MDSGQSVQWGGEEAVVSVIAFIKFHFFAAAKACARRTKASFMEGGVEKIPITPMLTENKVNSIEKSNP